MPPPNEPLPYTVEAASSYSGKYFPENILVDDRSTRWSGAYDPSGPPGNQWILLKLEKPSVVKRIKFGKFDKAHVCNLKQFKVYGGLDTEKMTEILHAGLKNDEVPETFNLHHRHKDGTIFPCQYIKIIPLAAYGQSFNTSIWFVALFGVSDESYVSRISLDFDGMREVSATRLILKHLRQRGHFTAYNALAAQSGLQIEHPLVSALYENIVIKGDFVEAERLFQATADESLLDSYIHSTSPTPLWTRIQDTNADGDVPTKRGGHQMTIDTDAGIIYMLGGWDGRQELSDFWAYHIAEGRWKIISMNTLDEGGPGPRSCHKMVFDKATGYIYLFGRFHDYDSSAQRVVPLNQPPRDATSPPPPMQHNRVRSLPSSPLPSIRLTKATTPSPYQADFYRYSTRGATEGCWELISSDTEAQGGPPLIFDHQMAVDSDRQIVYVFGGRVIESPRDAGRYSGMYMYDIGKSTWRLIFNDSQATGSHHDTIPSRAGHMMLLEPRSRQLYIFSGMRNETYLSDMHMFSLDTHEITQISSNYQEKGGPEAAFTQRATIDEELGEFYLLSGLSKDKVAAVDTVSPSLWIFRLEDHKWVPVQEPTQSEATGENHSHPKPRYAHQLVYDPRRKTFFLFGGNSGDSENQRLDDFWSLVFLRPAIDDVLRKAKLSLRRQRFIEMCNEPDALKALTYLQTDLSSVVDHTDEGESTNFRSLLANLLSRPTPDSFSTSMTLPPLETASLTSDDTDMADNTPVSSKPPVVLDPNVLERQEQTSAPAAPRPRHATATPLPHRGAHLPTPPPENAITETFSQRTAVFETLLEFISADAKQPVENLLDLIPFET